MDKIALVTGGNSGIGYATADLLKQRNYNVYIAGRNAGSISQAAKKLNVNALQADLGKLDDIESLAAHFSESGLDVLVNNAGIAGAAPVDQYTEENFTDHFHTNVRGPMFLIKQLIPAMEMRGAAITTVSSIIATHGFPGAAVYAATKGAVDAFTRSLALELAPRKIRVNAVAPGAIDTPIFKKMGLSEEQQQGIREHHAATVPLKRMGTPDEVAEVIVSQLDSTYVTGAVWSVDGGVDA